MAICEKLTDFIPTIFNLAKVALASRENATFKPPTTMSRSKVLGT